MYGNLLAVDQSTDVHRTYRIIPFRITSIHRNRFCSTAAWPGSHLLHITLLLTCSSCSLLLIAHTVRALLYCTVLHSMVQHSTVQTAYYRLQILDICKDTESNGCIMNGS